MFKTLALTALAITCLSFNAEARKPMTIRLPALYKVTGIQAEFLFNAMDKFDKLAGYEGTSDCTLNGVCTTVMNHVTCTKNMDEGPSQMFPGERNERFMTCSAQSTDPKRAFINVSYRDSEGVRELRHALVEITGKESVVEQSKSITVEKIECKATAMNRDMNTLEVETTYECLVTK